MLPIAAGEQTEGGGATNKSCIHLLNSGDSRLLTFRLKREALLHPPCRHRGFRPKVMYCCKLDEHTNLRVAVSVSVDYLTVQCSVRNFAHDQTSFRGDTRHDE